MVSDRVGTISFGTAPAARVTFGYSDPRDVVTSVQNQAGSPLATVSRYEYEYDGTGRRDSVLTTGGAFSASRFNLWDYNTRSELTASGRYNGIVVQDPPDPGAEIVAERRAYEYDPIGNRESATAAGGTPTVYDANEVNQYETATNPPVTFGYDADGNMLEDRIYAYAWDAENRFAPACSGRGGVTYKLVCRALSVKRGRECETGTRLVCG